MFYVHEFKALYTANCENTVPTRQGVLGVSPSMHVSTQPRCMCSICCKHRTYGHSIGHHPSAVATSMAEDTNKYNTPWDRMKEFQNDNTRM